MYQRPPLDFYMRIAYVSAREPLCANLCAEDEFLRGNSSAQNEFFARSVIQIRIAAGTRWLAPIRVTFSDFLASIEFSLYVQLARA